MNFFTFIVQNKKKLHYIRQNKQGLVLAPAVSGRGVGPDDGQDVGGDLAVLQRLLDLLQPHRRTAPHLLGRGKVVGDLQKHH